MHMYCSLKIPDGPIDLPPIPADQALKWPQQIILIPGKVYYWEEWDLVLLCALFPSLLCKIHTFTLYHLNFLCCQHHLISHPSHPAELLSSLLLLGLFNSLNPAFRYIPQVPFWKLFDRSCLNKINTGFPYGCQCLKTRVVSFLGGGQMEKIIFLTFSHAFCGGPKTSPKYVGTNICAPLIFLFHSLDGTFYLRLSKTFANAILS